jgi:tetraacyldisaccharide 4'-kinase
VFVAARRADAARALLAAHPAVDVLVCDDGLQHLALRRDIEICVFDRRGTGNGFLLPAGPLREPWNASADLVLHDAQTAMPGFAMHRQLADHGVDAKGRRVPLQDLIGSRITAVAGIANPEGFFGMLRALGLVLEHTAALPDHFDYEHWQAPGAGVLLCTEKDAAKLWPRYPAALAVPLVLSLDAAFWPAFDARLSSVHGHQTA